MPRNTKDSHQSIIRCRKQERWDPYAVHQILILQDLDPKTFGRLSAIKTKIAKGYLQVEYCNKKGSKREWGRLCAKNSLGYQSLSRKWRRILCHKNYIDIDIENCHFVILAQVCAKQAIECPVLLQYNQKRNSFFQLGEKKEIKEAFLKIAN